MCGELDRQLNDRKWFKKVGRAFSLTEVVVASGLLIAAIVPTLKAMTNSYICSTRVEHKTHSLLLAQSRIDEIRACTIYSYDESYSVASQPLGNGYMCTVVDSPLDTNLRRVLIFVGYDSNGDSNLAVGEMLVPLATQISKRW